MAAEKVVSVYELYVVCKTESIAMGFKITPLQQLADELGAEVEFISRAQVSTTEEERVEMAATGYTLS